MTKRSYTYGVKMLVRAGLLFPEMTLLDFKEADHEATLDEIKLAPQWSEATKQARAALFISFTRFLNRRTKGLIQTAQPCRDGAYKTFFTIREKVKTRAMTLEQWTRFLEELEKSNPRDGLIAKLILQGGKRKQEVLDLKTEAIDFKQRQIAFRQSKTRGVERTTVITYPVHVIEELKTYLGNRQGLVFLTRQKNPVHPSQPQRSFKIAGRKAGIPFPVTPHVLRTTTVTYLKQHGFSDSDIMKVTGHETVDMVRMYDKNDLAHNATQHISLV